MAFRLASGFIEIFAKDSKLRRGFASSSSFAVSAFKKMSSAALIFGAASSAATIDLVRSGFKMANVLTNVAAKGILALGAAATVAGAAFIASSVNMAAKAGGLQRVLAEPFEKLKGVFSDISMELGNALLPVVLDLADAFNAFIESEFFKSGVDKVKNFVVQSVQWIEVLVTKWGLVWKIIAGSFEIQLEKMTASWRVFAVRVRSFFGSGEDPEAVRAAIDALISGRTDVLDRQMQELFDAKSDIANNAADRLKDALARGEDVSVDPAARRRKEKVIQEFKVEFESGRFGFADLGKKIQDMLLVQEDPEKKRQRLAEINNQQNERLIDEMGFVGKSIDEMNLTFQELGTI